MGKSAPCGVVSPTCSLVTMPSAPQLGLFNEMKRKVMLMITSVSNVRHLFNKSFVFAISD